MAAEKISFIGGGNMGAAFAGGLVSAGFPPSRIWVTDVRLEVLNPLKKKLKIRTGLDNAAAVRASEVIVLCVKPQVLGRVLESLSGQWRSSQLVISIAAGISTGFIEKRVGKGVPVIRVMPNTPALLRAGALVYCLGRHVGKKRENSARRLLGTLGDVLRVEEKNMDAVTALSGSGPAYVFYLAECMAMAGSSLGISSEVSRSLARQTVYGAGLMLRESLEDAVELRRKVTSPGGTTEAALKVLDPAMSTLFKRALAEAHHRAGELSQAY